MGRKRLHLGNVTERRGNITMHPTNLTQCEFKRDRRITAVVPGNQASRSRRIIQKEKGFWSALPVIYELSILLTEKLIE